MKKVFLMLMIAMLLFSCKKERVNIDDIRGTMDLKGLSLPRLKALLDGKWRLHRFIRRTIAGTFYEKPPDNVGAILLFIPLIP